MMQAANQRQFVLEIYADLLQQIQQRIAPLVGSSTVQGMLEEARQATARAHSFVQALPLNEGQVDALTWARRCTDVPLEDLNAGLAQLVTNLFGSGPGVPFRSA